MVAAELMGSIERLCEGVVGRGRGMDLYRRCAGCGQYLSRRYGEGEYIGEVGFGRSVRVVLEG
jgi:hypothetical protein